MNSYEILPNVQIALELQDKLRLQYSEDILKQLESIIESFNYLEEEQYQEKSQKGTFMSCPCCVKE